MIKRKINFIEIFQKLFPFILKTCPVYFFVYCLCDITQGVSYGINTYFLQQFFDSITQNQGNMAKLDKVLLLGGAVAFIMIGLQILNGVSNFLFENLIKKISGHMSYLLNGKACRLDPILFEDPDVLDDINKAQEGAQRSVNIFFTFLSIFTFHLPYFIYMMVYLYHLKPTFSIILVIMILPMSISQYLKSKIYIKMEDKVAPLRRSYEYYENSICDIAFFKETRVLGAFGYFYNLYQKTIGLLNKAIWKAEKNPEILN